MPIRPCPALMRTGLAAATKAVKLCRYRVLGARMAGLAERRGYVANAHPGRVFTGRCEFVRATCYLKVLL